MAADRILVVDDEKNVIKSWSRALRLAGYPVRMAQSATEALHECDERHFDLVIIDFLMPSMTGVELLTRIRKKLPFVRSIIVSGKIDDGLSEIELSRALLQKIEADMYLHKPVSNERLLESVERLLKSKQALESWESVAKRARETAKATIRSAKQASKDLRQFVKKKGRR